MRGCPIIRNMVVASLLWTAFARAAFATSAEPARDLQVDPAPCLAAAVANDDDKTISVCGALIDNEKTARADRIKALIARGGAYERKDMTDRAIADYDGALRLDPALADIFNARGELWRKKGDRPQGAGRFRRWRSSSTRSIRPRAANYKSLAQELERLGALKAVAGKPSFNCATAQAAGGEGDLRQSRACRSRSRDQCDECQDDRRGQGSRASPRAAARAGRVHRPPQRRFRPAGLRSAQGHAGADARSSRVSTAD